MVAIHDLVSKYRIDRASYLKINYNETQLRNDFIDPLLKFLGWDVDNSKGNTYFLRDVIQEESIEIKDESTKKNPDYTLRINGTRKLFVEAKKPSVDIIKSAKAAFQTRRYGWSANLKISILTNFEHIIIYDCNCKPNEADNEHVARYKAFSFDEYENAFDEISSLISYKAVNSGKLDDIVDINKREGDTFDEYFLQQIESWREKLARTAIKNNSELNEEDVNFIIQRLLNRIIFLRICEDRTILKYETIRKIKNYDELKKLFKESDKKFNSGLFDFIEDALSLEVNIDTEVLIGIFNELYFPQSPYDFSVVDPTILSQIYERFLGKKITIEPGRTFNIMEAPEVSASSGVVPTPKIIVEKIVKETLTPLVEGKNFRQLNDLKIADICCGSGTFLISAYDFLLQKMMEKVIKERINDFNLTYQAEGKGLTFTLKGKRNILENNLYGIDINPYAVEVTVFSLLLKVLEDEDNATIENFMQQHSEKILPNLKTNIKCGNSLVDNKFFDFLPEALDDDELLFKVKPFDWEVEYPDIMKKGGFNAIIGNPPYVRIQNMQKYNPDEIKYYKSTESQYTVAKKATIDKYFVFIERALELINSTGFLGYIVPHKFFITKGGKELRKIITVNYQIYQIVHFGVTQVFPERLTYTAILILQANKTDDFMFKKVNKLSTEAISAEEHITYYKTENYNIEPWIFLTHQTQLIFQKFKGEQYEMLGEITDIAVGLQTSADKIYIFIPEIEKNDTFVFRKKGKRYEVEKQICRTAIYDLSFSAFESIQANAQMIFPYKIEDGIVEVLDEETMASNYPLTWVYLNEFRTELEKRSLQGQEPIWYQYGRSQSLTKFQNTEKLVWSVLATNPPYVLDKNNLLFTGGGNGPYYGLINESDYSILYILGILTHPIIESMVKAGASEFQGAYYSHGKQFIQKLPIKKIDFSNQKETSQYQQVLKLVNNLIESTAQLKEIKIGAKKTVISRKIDALYKKLINVINDLYGISDEEFKIVMSDEMLDITLGEDN